MLLNIQDIDYFFAYLRLGELEKYLDTSENYLQKAKEEFVARADEQVKNLPPEQRQEFYEFYQDDYWRHEEKFPRILRNSFLVSALSLLEYEMNVICRRLKKEQQRRISWRNLKFDVLEQFKEYCNLAGLSLSYDNPTWQDINNYYMVRNCIVHNSGLIKELPDKDRKDLIPYLNRKHLISQDTIEQEIALTEQFCKEVINTMQDFLANVYTAYINHKEGSKH